MAMNSADSLQDEIVEVGLAENSKSRGPMKARKVKDLGKLGSGDEVAPLID